MASRQDSDNDAPPRKRALISDSVSTSLSSTSGSLASSPGWSWPSTAVTRNDCGHIDTRTVSSSPATRDRVGTGPCPSTTPFVFDMTTPKTVSQSVDTSSKRPTMTSNGTPLVGPPLSPDFRLLYGRQPGFYEESNVETNDRPVSWPACNSSAFGPGTPWQHHDFGDGLSFDVSLSGLSDLAAPSYANEVIEFVKRQSSHPVSSEDGFQFILMAPTSAAIRFNEETLTYLNHGQSYEIKCKKLANDAGTKRLYKSIVRITFHDRRQKFHERELLDQWKKVHSNEKIIEADIPLSYNIISARTDAAGTMLEFVWDPAKATSLFVKVNCISTEFTPRKQGGEKGVPFRLQVDTYQYGDSAEQKIQHSSYAQVKVFKTKGADRKNKTDREKAKKQAATGKYQPAYDYTILTETYPVDFCEADQCRSTDTGTHVSLSPVAIPEPRIYQRDSIVASSPENTPSTRLGNGKLACRITGVTKEDDSIVPTSVDESDNQCLALPVDATPNETSQWLRRHRFGAYLKMFSCFSGVDLLRFSREDLIQICGVADGIRLFNALQWKTLQPKLTLYIRVPGAPAFYGVFLVSLTLQELVSKVCDLVQVQPSQVVDVYCQQTDGINVHVNNDVVENLPDRSRYSIDTVKCGDEQSERYRILLIEGV